MLAARLLGCVALFIGGAAAQAPGAGAAVVLNEINCEGTDWVELVNTSDSPADISGWLLTDYPLGSTDATHRYLFPAGAIIPPLDDLVVERGTSGFPFGISCGGDTVRLADATETLIDEIAVPTLTSPLDTWGRYPNGTGPWLQTAPTRGSPNEPSSSDPPEDMAGWMFEPDTVVEIDLDLPPESVAALNVDPDEYQPASFSLTTAGGTYGPLTVGARLKGSGSFRPLTGKSAFKIKFNEFVAGQRFLGLRKLTLNNMVQDRSMIHEVLAYEAFRSVDVAAPRAGYAYVRVNDDDYGLYLNVETLDAVSLPRWFDSTQHLYEGEPHGVFGTDVTPGNAGAFEVDEGSETDRSDLEALIAAANDDVGDWSDGMAGVADLEQMTRMWAVEKYTGHWDSYSGGALYFNPNNYYLHSDATGVFRMLPWGTDQTWEADQHLAFDGAGSLMFNECLADSSCFAMYRNAVQTARDTVAGLNLDALAVSESTLLAPWQEMDPRREYSLADIAAEVSSTRAFIAARPGEADAWLNPPAPPAPPAAPPAPPPALSVIPRNGSVETTITKRPRARTDARRVIFKFESSEPGSTFTCGLDDRPYKPCNSPKQLKAAIGKHTFRVRATSPAGVGDQTPARAKFEVTG